MIGTAMNGQDDAEVGLVPAAHVDDDRDGRVPDVRRARERRALGPQRPGDQVGHDLDRDVVEHDRGDDLVGARERLEDAGDEAVDRARHRRQDGDRRPAMNGGAPDRAPPTAAAATAPIRNWPWPPMLKRPGLEAEAHREADQDQRRAGSPGCRRAR